MTGINTGISKRIPASNDYKAIPFASKQNSVCEFDHPEAIKKHSGQLSVCN
jgi:hypothetical protein